MILGLTIDSRLSLDNHVKKICRKGSHKDLCIIKNIKLFRLKKEILFKGMIRSQFSYWPLIRMLSSRISNNLINKYMENL